MTGMALGLSILGAGETPPEQYGTSRALVISYRVMPRCWGSEPPEFRKYHDDEWGRPVTDDVRLYEKLCLEGFQCGMSWLTIFRKRDNFHAAFAGFDPAAVARFGQRDVKRLLSDVGIVRNRGKIEAAIANARATLDVQESEGSLAALVWRYAPTARRKAPRAWADIPASTPGHHLQLSLGQEMENVPEFRKHVGYSSFVEGWALYAESLGEELHLYKDPYSKFGQLSYEMWRAVRLVVDTGMHTMGWTRQQAIDFFRENTGKTDQDITVEVDRYIVWPGQALAYKIGQMKIRELRTEAEKKLGTKFDVRKFHDAVLENGAVPLEVLEARTRHWIDLQAAQ